MTENLFKKMTLILSLIVYTGLLPVLTFAQLTPPPSQATVPGFKVPDEIATLKKLEAKCKGAALNGNFRICLRGEVDYFEYYENEQLLGQVKTNLPKGGNSIYIIEIQVSEHARGRGLSTLLLEKVVQASGPHLSEIGAEMAASNYAAVLREYYEISTPGLPRFNPELTKHQAQVLALKASPFYKSVAKFGFTEITMDNFEWVLSNGPAYVSQIIMIVKRPTK